MKTKKNILENIDGFAMFALIWAFIINLVVLLVNLFRYYILDAGSWRTIYTSFEFAILIIILLVVLLAIISPLYQKVVKAVTDPAVSHIEYGEFRRNARKFLVSMFECSKDEARAIDKFWEQMSVDFIKLSDPSICTPAKIFDEAEKAQEWQQNCSAYLGGSSFMFDPRKSLKLRMFKRAASIDFMLNKIRDFCASSPTIVNVSTSEILTAYDEYITSLLLETRTEEQHESLSKQQLEILTKFNQQADKKSGRKEVYDRLTKGMDHYKKIIANRNAQTLMNFYKD